MFAIMFSMMVCLLLLSSATYAQDDPDDRYFDEVGFEVAKEFWPFFTNNGGLEIFGYPISPIFLDPQEGLWVQYFQNGRVEMSPEGFPRLSALPDAFYRQKRQPPIASSETPPGAEYYEPTGHSVMLAFLDFYMRHGGPRFFGYPISEVVNEGDRLTQYFERAAFEWQPEFPDGQRVQLASLGDHLLRNFGNFEEDDDGHLRIGAVLDIFVSAAVQKPVMEQEGGLQKVYVYVFDQLGRPVSRAQVEVSIRLPQGGEVHGPLAPTNDNGVVVFDLAIPPLAAGETIPIQVYASYQDDWKDTACSFRVWW